MPRPPPYHERPVPQPSPPWRLEQPGDQEAFPHADAYRDWMASGMPHRGLPPNSMPWDPNESWRQSAHHGSSRTGSTNRWPATEASQWRGYHSGRDTSNSLGQSYSSSGPSCNGKRRWKESRAPRRQQSPMSGPDTPQHSGLSAMAPPAGPSDVHPRPHSPDSVHEPWELEGSPRYLDSTLPRPTARGKPTRPPSPFVVPLPPAPYIEMSRGSTHRTLPATAVIPKLLVLDLNGALLYRTEYKGRSDGRRIYARPYLPTLLRYLFDPDPEESDLSVRARPWEVFVWSSAQSSNVRKMVEAVFLEKHIDGIWEKRRPEKEGEARVLGVWARDRMGLNQADYYAKTQTHKDLRKVISHLRDTEENDRNYCFDERTTVLLDDSPLKAIFQPWSQIIVSEFNRKEFEAHNCAAARLDDSDRSDRTGLDVILLGVIGILEELRTVENVPAWVRAGGLTPTLTDAEREDDVEVLGELAIIDGEPSVESLPSHEAFAHWYKSPSILKHWTERGKLALAKRSIDIEEVAAPVRPMPAHQAVELYARRNHSPPRPLDELRREAPREAPRRNFSTGHLPTQAEAVVDIWRTFRAVDVSSYLADVADRPSSLDEQRRAVHLNAVEVLRSMAPDSVFDEPITAEQSAAQGFHPDMCVSCTMTAGKEELKRRNAAANAKRPFESKKQARLKKHHAKLARRKPSAPAKVGKPPKKSPQRKHRSPVGMVLRSSTGKKRHGQEAESVGKEGGLAQAEQGVLDYTSDASIKFFEESSTRRFSAEIAEIRTIQQWIARDTERAETRAKERRRVHAWGIYLTTDKKKRGRQEGRLAELLASLPVDIRQMTQEEGRVASRGPVTEGVGEARAKAEAVKQRGRQSTKSARVGKRLVEEAMKDIEAEQIWVNSGQMRREAEAISEDELSQLGDEELASLLSEREKARQEDEERSSKRRRAEAEGDDAGPSLYYA